jgi:hypothetical protein
LYVTEGGAQKAEHVAHVRLAGHCAIGLKTVSEAEFDRAINGLAKEGATLTFSKRDRNYYATFASPVLGAPVVTRGLTVLRSAGRPAFIVSRLNEAPGGQTSALVDEFRITRAK